MVPKELTVGDLKGFLIEQTTDAATVALDPEAMVFVEVKPPLPILSLKTMTVSSACTSLTHSHIGGDGYALPGIRPRR